MFSSPAKTLCVAPQRQSAFRMPEEQNSDAFSRIRENYFAINDISGLDRNLGGEHGAASGHATNTRSDTRIIYLDTPDDR